VIPVGPPDEEARRAIWRGYIQRITDQDVDVERLVEATSLFTPADIDFAAHKAGQAAFERTVVHEDGTRATIDEFLTAINETRPSLTRSMVHEFEEDIDAFARV
ncbi:MAG: AAA family ATPase, partial [Actinobacteria bacterium]|nr:AAA family ATPase [Actinomycetota bacterium]